MIKQLALLLVLALATAWMQPAFQIATPRQQASTHESSLFGAKNSDCFDALDNSEIIEDKVQKSEAMSNFVCRAARFRAKRKTPTCMMLTPLSRTSPPPASADSAWADPDRPTAPSVVSKCRPWPPPRHRIVIAHVRFSTSDAVCNCGRLA